MRSNASITAIRGNAGATAFIEGAAGSVWLVSADGDVRHLATSGVRDVQMGYYHGAVLYNDGTVATFLSHARSYERTGDNWCLGIGEVKPPVAELRLTDLRNIVAVQCGLDFTVALDADGVLWFAGSNQEGQFGLGTSGRSARNNNHGTNRFVPGTLTGVAGIAVGASFTFATLVDGSVHFAGRDVCHASGIGQNGVPQYENFTPTGLNNVQLHTSHRRSVAIGLDGTVWHAGDARTAPGSPRGHFAPAHKWERVENVHIDQIVVQGDYDVIMIDHDGKVLVSGGVSDGCAKLGREFATPFSLSPNGETAEQVAMTASATFLRQNGEWVSSTLKNPNLCLSMRDVTSWKPGYAPMAHPADWQIATQMLNLGMTWSEAHQAAQALA